MLTSLQQNPVSQEITSGLTQSNFENLMSPEIAEFVQIHEEALKRTLTRKATLGPNYINRTWDANEMNSNIKGQLIEKFGSAIKVTPSQRFYYEKAGQPTILFKKLTPAFYPENINTKSSKAILNQRSMDFDGPVIFVGYVPNKTRDHLDYIMAVYISNGEIIWKSNLRAVMMNQTVKQVEMFDQSFEEPEVKIKQQG